MNNLQPHIFSYLKYCNEPKRLDEKTLKACLITPLLFNFSSTLQNDPKKLNYFLASVPTNCPQKLWPPKESPQHLAQIHIKQGLNAHIILVK